MKLAEHRASADKLNRVLITGDTVGGVWTFVMELAEGLTRRGTEVMLATFGPSFSDVQRSQANAIENLEWRHFPSKLEWMDESWSDIAEAGTWLLKLVAAYKPDLIHLNTLCYGDLPVRTPVITTVHSCVQSWWAAVKKAPISLKWQTYRTHVERSLQSATLVVAPSRSMLRELSRCYCLNPGSPRVIYNGRSKQSFKLLQKQPFILSVGRLWDEGKNVRALADIAGELKWPVYLAGSVDGPFDTSAVFPNCRHLGQLSTPELANWYGQASIYSLPARYEPFGLSVLEAALSQCALVLGDIPSLREIWDDAAIYVNPDDRNALSNALQALIADPERRQKMASSAHQRAAKFSHDTMITSYRQAYIAASRLFEQTNRRRACAS